ncbi:MAG: FtsX-like permease family protein, partial [Bryobacteraceae bacterium]
MGEGYDVALPICAEPIVDAPMSSLDYRGAWWLQVMGRRKPGVMQQLAAARLAVISPPALANSVPQDWDPDMQNDFLNLTLTPESGATGASELRRKYDRALTILMGVVGVLLLIACANLASLMLARAAARKKEMAVRLAIGASRGRLIRQLLTECLLLSLLGGALGVLFARWGAGLVVGLISTTRSPVFLNVSTDIRVLGFTFAAAVLAGLLFGVLPAIRSTRVSLTSTMKASESTQSEGGTRFHTGRWIVAAQVAMSLVLVVVAGLFVRTFVNLLRVDAGFDRSNVILASLDLQSSHISAVSEGAQFDQILERVNAIPGVESAS